MKIIKENIYDVVSQDQYKIVYTGNKVLSIDRLDHKNKLYFFDDYVKFADRDFIWITEDDFIIEIDDSVLKLFTRVDGFIQNIRKLKTEDKIKNYISFLQL